MALTHCSSPISHVQMGTLRNQDLLHTTTSVLRSGDPLPSSKLHLQHRACRHPLSLGGCLTSSPLLLHMRNQEQTEVSPKAEPKLLLHTRDVCLPGARGRWDECLSLFMCSALSAAVSRVDTTPSSMAKSCRNTERTHSTHDPGIPILQGTHQMYRACLEPH